MERDTIVQTYSITKTMTALVALVLADNGVLTSTLGTSLSQLVQRTVHARLAASVIQR